MSFIEHLAPVPVKGLLPITVAEKLAWLAENTKKHRMGAVDREEHLQHAVRKIETMRSKGNN